MKNGLIKLIKLYQKIPLRCHDYCRHIPTCSEYMIEAINEYGATKGLYLGIKRILKCRPKGSYGYDPLIKKERI